MAEGTFGGDWQDEGIYFTLVVQGALAVIFLIIFAIFHSASSTSKVLRPARPDSKWARFMTRRDTAALFERDENEVAMRVSVFSAIQLLILKYRAQMFIGGFLTATCLCVIFGTDSYISSYGFRYDSYGCKDRSSSDDCKNSGVCAWTGSACEAIQLYGLQDLTLLNVTPTHFRSWLIGIFTVAFHIWFAFCAIKMMVEMRVLVFSSKTMPVQLQSEKLALVAKPGSRSVRVSGISEAQCRTFDGTAASLFMKQIKIQTAKYTKQEQEEKDKQAAAPAPAPDAPVVIPPKDQVAAIAKLLTKKAGETIIVYQAPQTEDDVQLTELILEENELLEVIREEAAKGEDGSPCCSCCCTSAQEKLKVVQDKIKSLRSTSSKYEASSSTQQEEKEGATAAAMNPLASMYSPWKITQHTAAIITFDTSANAHKFAQLLPEFVKNYSSSVSTEAADSLANEQDNNTGADNYKEEGVFTANITGPASHVLYDDLAPDTAGSYCKSVVLIVTYIVFILFGSIIIAFFGSIESLASIPGLGDVFGKVVDVIPVALFRILQAYLPVIAAAIFQMLIPPLMRSIASSFRLGNWEMREASTFKFMFGYVFMTGVILQTALQGGIFQLAGLIENPSVTDVMNFLISIFSPKGGYFFALVASSAVFSVLMQTLGFGNVFHATCLASREVLEEKRVIDEKPRNLIFDIPSALWMLMFSFGVLFHSTSPLLLMFVTCYFISAYYTFRTLILDISNRDPKKNITVDTTLSSAHATSQVKVMLLLHTLGCVGTFVVFILKFLWGAAAMTSVTLLINYYLWHVKWTTLDTMLNTTDLTMIDHYDHLLSRRSRSAEEKKKQQEQNEEEKNKQNVPGFLPPFARTYKFNEYNPSSQKEESKQEQHQQPAPEIASTSAEEKPVEEQNQ